MSKENEWYKKYIEISTHIKKRASTSHIPTTTIHTMPIIYYAEEFVIYEQYGTQYLKTI